ncbi:MAG TPA: hypothetical protein VHE10_00430 [Candidatus Paceibacterota bacterium]|nr:hypothetical protein [Candidatus Paceibacterota bacterium]
MHSTAHVQAYRPGLGSLFRRRPPQPAQLPQASRPNANIPVDRAFTYSELVALGKYWMVVPWFDSLYSGMLMTWGRKPKLFKFGKCSPQEAAARIAEQGYRPGLVGDLLYFGKDRPVSWMFRRVVAPGHEGQNPTPVLVSCYPGKRMLDVAPRYQLSNAFFLGVRD